MSTTAIIINTGYLKTCSGLLKLGELVLGAVCVGLVANYLNVYNFAGNVPVMFFLLMSTTFMIATFCLLLSCLISIATSNAISNTIYEVVYHIVAFILYLAAALTLLIEVVGQRRNHYYYYDAYMAASIIGLVVASLYFFSAIIAIRSYKGT